MPSTSRVRFWTPLAVMLAGLYGVSAWTLYDLWQDSYAIATANARNLQSVLSNDIEGDIRAYDRTLSQVAAKLASPGLSTLDAPLQQSYLFDDVLVQPYFTSLLVLDAAGNVVRDAGAFPHRVDNFADRDYFEAQRDGSANGLFISDPFRRRLTGTDRVIALSRRIAGPNGTFAGVIVGTVRLDYFLSLFQRAALHPGDSINLFSGDGVLLMRAPYLEDRIGRDMSATPNVQRFLAEGTGTFAGTAAVDGVRRVYTFSRVGDLPLIMNVALDEEEIYAGWWARAAQISAVLALLSLVAFAMSVRTRRELVRRAEAETAVLRSETEYKLLADNATDIIIRLDRTYTRQYVSPACRRVVGYEPSELIGRKSRELIHPDDWPVVEGIMASARRTGEPAEATYRLRHRSGDDVWVEGRYGHIASEDCYLVVLRDVTKRKKAEAELAKAHARLQDLANKDGLTGLANRRQFDEALAEEWRKASTAAAPISLLLLDVDHFKRYNDRYGHQAGDECLRGVAAAVAASVRSGDIVARYGGEEFAVILPGSDVATARFIGLRIRDAVRGLRIEHAGKPYADENPVVTMSVGAASGDGTDPDTPEPAHLVRRADAALYEAKRRGRDRVVAEDDLSTSVDAPDQAQEEERLRLVGEVRERLTAVRTEILDELARKAAAIMGTPVGFVSLVDRDGVRLIGRHGIDATVVPRDLAFCSHTVNGFDPLMITDLSTDPRFANSPLVAGENGLRFYAGAPFAGDLEGVNIGAVCAVSDRVHGDPTPEQRRALQKLGEFAAACVNEGSRPG